MSVNLENCSHGFEDQNSYEKLVKDRNSLKKKLNNRRTAAIATSCLCCPCVYVGVNVLTATCCPFYTTYYIGKKCYDWGPKSEKMVEWDSRRKQSKLDEEARKIRNPGPQNWCDIALKALDPCTCICPGETRLKDFSLPEERLEMKSKKNEINKIRGNLKQKKSEERSPQKVILAQESNHLGRELIAIDY